MLEKQKLILAILWIAGFVSVVPFIIGLILNTDGLQMLIDHDRYNAGFLNVDSVSTGPIGENQSSTIQAIGYVDSVFTGLTIGSTDSPSVRKLLLKLATSEKVLLPVWYKPDGKLTIDRYPDESIFPVNRICNKVFLNIFFFNLPLVVIIIVRWYLKRKFKNLIIRFCVGIVWLSVFFICNDLYGQPTISDNIYLKRAFSRSKWSFTHRFIPY